MSVEIKDEEMKDEEIKDEELKDEELKDEATNEQAEEPTEAQEAQDATGATEGEEAAGDGKKLFKKKKKDKRDEQIEELTDRVKRQMAEFENFRKRTEKEKTQMFDMGAKTIVEKILPVIDNFERGFSTVEEADKDDAFVQGMDMVYKQLMTELTNAGVTPIEAVGKEFDPELHNAVMQVESEEFESGVVAQELQKGYMYKDQVVRHSMVAVVS
ncbi:MAG: nucleotide exchange factor GrpE [Agathobacter sp.]|uniref:nucleotide exchange factor GrpE n=1 Tax=Agathobacter sp. TaxID=2021311 RepID=UPI002588A7B1|nr:nucleotide exchange factor GrpE [Agathobacter sp.]MCR5678427.1 nucleotide exchange factor GrpE [Agathobacter sp.]